MVLRGDRRDSGGRSLPADEHLVGDSHLEKAIKLKKSIDGRDKTIDCCTLVMRRVIWRMIIPLVVWDATPQGRRPGRSPIALSKVVQDETMMDQTELYREALGYLRHMGLDYFISDT